MICHPPLRSRPCRPDARGIGVSSDRWRWAVWRPSGDSTGSGRCRGHSGGSPDRSTTPCLLQWCPAIWRLFVGWGSRMTSLPPPGRAGSCTIPRVWFINGGLPGDLGVVLDFGRLRSWLWEEARRHGVELIQGCRAALSTLTADQASVRLQTCDGRTSLRSARWLIDATGARRDLLQQAGLSPNPEDPLLQGIGVEWLLQADDRQAAAWRDRISFFLGTAWIPHGYGWIFPMQGQRLKVGVCHLPPSDRPIPWQPGWASSAFDSALRLERLSGTGSPWRAFVQQHLPLRTVGGRCASGGGGCGQFRQSAWRRRDPSCDGQRRSTGRSIDRRRHAWRFHDDGPSLPTAAQGPAELALVGVGPSGTTHLVGPGQCKRGSAVSND